MVSPMAMYACNMNPSSEGQTSAQHGCCRKICNVVWSDQVRVSGERCVARERLPLSLTSCLHEGGNKAQKGCSQKISRSTMFLAASGWAIVYAHEGSR